MSFKDFFKRLLSTKAHPAHLPYILTPPPHQPDTSSSPNQLPHNAANTDFSYTESEVSIHTIAGTNIGFGTQKIVQVDSVGQAKDISQTQSHLIGSGKLVSKVEDVAGVCKLCQAIAMEQLQAGQISVQQAQLLSLYDKSSAAICDVCGIQGCVRHIRPLLTENGVLAMCETCQRQLKKQLRKQKIVGLLLSPFMETKNPNEE